MRVSFLTFALSTLAWSLTSVAADGPPQLRKNPFSRPPSNVTIDDRVSIRDDEVVSDSFELQATMIGTVNKLANVDGRILKPGDEIQGHVLVAIHERYAVFRRNGKDTTVYVKPQQVRNRRVENDE